MTATDDALSLKAFPDTCGTHTTDNPTRYDVAHCKGVEVGATCDVKVSSEACASGLY
jgi:hypothetical protein